jgi:hypothetical protein
MRLLIEVECGSPTDRGHPYNQELLCGFVAVQTCRMLAAAYPTVFESGVSGVVANSIAEYD